MNKRNINVSNYLIFPNLNQQFYHWQIFCLSYIKFLNCIFSILKIYFSFLKKNNNMFRFLKLEAESE